MAEPKAAQPRLARPRQLQVLAGGGLVAVTATVVVAWTTGATDVVPLPGIPVPSTLVTWLVPILRLLADLAAVVCVGCLLGAAVLVPGDRTLTPAGYRWIIKAGWAALVWTVAALAALPVQLADFLGTRLPVVSLRGVVGFVTDVDQGRAQFLTAVLAALVAVAARAVLTRNGARVLLVVALSGTVPPAFTGHAADESDHTLAVSAVALHVVGVVLWAGGLVALLLARQLGTAGRSEAVVRFSRLALPFAVTVGVSGLLTAYTRLSTAGQLVETSYGRVVLVKAVALLGLVAIGWWHRRTSLPALAAGRSGAFVRIATAEVLLFAVTIGVAVGLSRAPAPPTSDPGSGAAVSGGP